MTLWRTFRTDRPRRPSMRVAVQDWQDPTLLNSWVAFGASNNAPGFWLDPLGIVHLRGVVKSGTVATGSTGTIFTLPDGYRPAFEEIFAVASNGAFGVCRVLADGSVRAYSGNNTYFSLDGITFRISR